MSDRNVQCAYLAEFLWRSFSALLPDVSAPSPFDPEVIAWCLFERLAALPEIPEYRALTHSTEAKVTTN